jgi:hypothetical protein
MPVRVLRPTEASIPESGRSIPISIVFPEGALELEHAAKASARLKAAIEAARRRIGISGGLASG